MSFILLAIPITFAIIIIIILLLKKRNVSKKILSVKLIEKNKITHDTIMFTFLLENQQQPLGLKVGQHLEMIANIPTKDHPQGEVVTRKYTPISNINKKGSFDLLIKIYRPCQRYPDGGLMTQWLAARTIGQNIMIRIPFGRFNYLGDGQVAIKTFGNQSVEIKNIKKLYMVSGGTGLTPLYQIIQYVTQSKDKSIEIILLTLNRTQKDVLLQNQLQNFQKVNEKFKCYFSVDKSITQDWKGFTGYINKEKLQKTMGNIDNSTLFVSCGPPILNNVAQRLWGELGIPATQIFRF